MIVANSSAVRAIAEAKIIGHGRGQSSLSTQREAKSLRFPSTRR